jgi:hypothetical protein
MIYSIVHKFIFIRNPACANRSIAKALEPFSTEYNRKGFGFKHCTYKKQKSSDIFNISEIFDDDFFVFTGVRNPWERVYNLFEGQRIMKVVETPFTDRLDRSMTDWNAKNKTINDNLKNLTEDVRLMLNQKDYRVGVDFVYQFENLEEDFEYICDKLKINARLPAKEESYSNVDFKDNTYRQHFNEKSKKIVEQINKEDIIEFGYEF